MFLSRLNKREKKVFLQLAHYIASVDGEYSAEEELGIYRFCQEMKISDIEFDPENFDSNISLKEIKNKKSQKIVILELLALIYSDNKYKSKEKQVIIGFFKTFNLNPYLFIIYTEWAKNAISLVKQGEALLEI